MGDKTQLNAHAIRSAGRLASRARSLAGAMAATFVSLLAIYLVCAQTSDLDLLRGAAREMPLGLPTVPIHVFTHVAPPLVWILHLLQLVYLSAFLRSLRIHANDSPLSTPADPLAATAIVMSRSQIGRCAIDLLIVALCGYLPLLLILYIEVKYLPLHSSGLLWFHRSLVLADAITVAVALCAVGGLRGEGRVYKTGRLTAVGAIVFVALFSQIIVGFRGERFVSVTPIFSPVRRALIWRHHHDVYKLSGLRLVGYDDIPIDLRGRDLRGAQLEDAWLSEAVLDDAHLDDANLRGATLAGASMVATSLSNARMDFANMRNVHLQWATAHAASFLRADLREADCRGLKALGANFRRARLEGSDLSFAVVQFARLDGADLRGATMHGTDARGTFWATPDYEDSAQLALAMWSGGWLDASRFGDSNLDGVSLHGISLIGVDGGRLNCSGAVIRAKPDYFKVLTWRAVLPAAVRVATRTSENTQVDELQELDEWLDRRQGFDLLEFNGAIERAIAVIENPQFSSPMISTGDATGVQKLRTELDALLSDGNDSSAVFHGLFRQWQKLSKLPLEMNDHLSIERRRVIAQGLVQFKEAASDSVSADWFTGDTVTWSRIAADAVPQAEY